MKALKSKYAVNALLPDLHYVRLLSVFVDMLGDPQPGC